MFKKILGLSYIVLAIGLILFVIGVLMKGYINYPFIPFLD